MEYGTKIDQCQVCGDTPLTSVLSLGHHPSTQAYLTEETLKEREVRYPLTLCRCEQCGLLQLNYIVAPETVFPPDYPYKTGMTNMLVRNFSELAEHMVAQYDLQEGDLVVDIGSNDGTLLSFFKEKGIKVLGIEPTDVAQVANDNGIPTLQEFFTFDQAQQIVSEYGHAKVVTATNAFAHIPEINRIVEGINALLTDDGVFVSESQYVMDIIDKMEFDTIYHEHLRFYSLAPLETLFEQNGMSMVDAERIEAAGGSIRVFAVKGDKGKSDRVQQLMREEEEKGMNTSRIYEEFAQKAIAAKRSLLALLLSCKEEGSRVVGVSSPARANSLLNFTNIDHHLLDYAGERTGSLKIGMYTPGTHIPVVDESRILEEQPEYALMLSWHIGPELMKKLRERGYKGTFIMPLPDPRMVTDI